MRFEDEHTVLVTRGVPLDEAAFVSSIAPLGELDMDQLDMDQFDVEPTGNTGSSELYSSDVVIEEYRWLQEWAVFQRSKPDGLSWIRRHGWDYSQMSFDQRY